MAARGRRPGFAETFRRSWTPPAKRRAAAPTSPPAAPGKAPAPRPKRGKAPSGPNGARASGSSKASPALLKRRDELSKQFAELQWDLGGITYEMARRDHYRLEVLNAQAAKLQEVVAELGQIERMVKLDEAGAAGYCQACGAPQARGAAFCWKCGKEVSTPKTTEAKVAEAKATAPKPKPTAKKAPKVAKLRKSRSSSKARSRAKRS
jgi:hypothetical protein